MTVCRFRQILDERDGIQKSRSFVNTDVQIDTGSDLNVRIVEGKLSTVSKGLMVHGAICLALTSIDMGPVACNYPNSDLDSCPDPDIPKALDILQIDRASS
jgi:hypothetical protein